MTVQEADSRLNKMEKDIADMTEDIREMRSQIENAVKMVSEIRQERKNL